MSNVDIEIGHEVDRKIRTKGITKRAISDKTGMPYSTLNSKLKGYRSFNINEILAIAEVLEEPPAALLPEPFKSPALAGKEVD
ncbi:helix-turn-helix domain-containing protein [Bifidobacterium amazonense]|uniref:Helix-turn-helix domain-containing protein n=1 Tax=Bifidobacterium amazonense TaxID=2809027 RepID=A0ABS9VSA9_9BIFI|nr:helix-turn-helix transcriptional regulator [Bifidobacterium amazonense]MCH9274967.1 helix-turn-helix domain-containing protein [Bifidobacterium amazonense]